MRIFCLHVYGFVICCSPFNALGVNFAFLGMTLASLWLPWDAGGSLWGDLGSQGALLGVTLVPSGSLGMPVGPFGAAWTPKWSLG